MKSTRIRDKILRFLDDRPRNTEEILAHINSTIRYGTTSQQLTNVLSKDKSILMIGEIKGSGILSPGGTTSQWASKKWLAEAGFEINELDQTVENPNGMLSVTALSEPEWTGKKSGLGEDLDDKFVQIQEDQKKLLRRLKSMFLPSRMELLSDLKKEGTLPNPVEFSFSDFMAEPKSRLNAHSQSAVFSRPRSTKYHGWDVFPLSAKHFDAYRSSRQLMDDYYGHAPLFNQHDLIPPVDDLKDFASQFRRFPLRLTSARVEDLSALFSFCRIAGAFNQSERTSSDDWILVSHTADGMKPLLDREYDALVEALNNIQFILSQHARLLPNPELCALAFSVSLERFVLSKQRQHFMNLLKDFEALTKPRGRNAFLDEIPTNRIHPCFQFDDPVLGAHLFMNMAVIGAARQNPTVLEDHRLKGFLHKGSKLLDREVFEFAIPSRKNKSTNIHVEQDASSSFEELRRHYRKLLKDSIHLMSGNNVLPFGRRLNKDVDLEFMLAQPRTYQDEPSFWQVEEHQVEFRRFVKESYQLRASGKGPDKRAERDFLAGYGDMAVPNPLRTFNSNEVQQRPRNALEAIERVSNNPKNQGLRTQNRLVAMLDMVWSNFHRRESYGKRFVGLDLLEELEACSLNGQESMIAEGLLFHQQKVIRLFDNHGKERKSRHDEEKNTEPSLSRINKVTRNNLYARILHQMNSFLDDPNQDLDHLARPPMSSPLRRLLHPIRLQSYVDLEFEDLPVGAVLAIALSRMETLVDAYESTFQAYFEKLGELSSPYQADAPSIINGNMLRSLATLLCLEVCQLHHMLRHLKRKADGKKSHMHYYQTKLAVEGHDFDAIRADFAYDIKFDQEFDSSESVPIAAVLEGQGLPRPSDLLRRLNHFCYSGWGTEDNTRRVLTQNELKLVASMNLFVNNDEPTGAAYVELVRAFDTLYVEHGPRFTSPDAFAFNTFEYF